VALQAVSVLPNKLQPPGLSPANRWNTKVTFHRQNTVVAALREALVDADKVLKALNDRAERDLDQFIAEDVRNHALREQFLSLGEASGQIWEIMRDAFSQGPDFEYPESIKRRELRQAMRTLNLGSRAVTALLKASAVEHGDGANNYRNSPRYRMEYAKQALYISEGFAGKCSPGPKNYNHPQFTKWHKLCAQCKRRIAAIYLDDARSSDEKAQQGAAAAYGK
jgi:uncharacterized protein with HEPN domain